MGDLDLRWNEQAIADIWTHTGITPVSVKMVRDGREPGGGYCFVSFASAHEVQSALALNGSTIAGTSKSFRLNQASRGRNGPEGLRQNPSNDFSIFVGDLGPDVSEPMLYEAFNSLLPGQIKQVKVMMDISTRTSKGFGFVRFFDSGTQRRALAEANGMVVGSRAIRVGMAASSKNPANSGQDVQPAQHNNLINTTQHSRNSNSNEPPSNPEILPKHARFSDPRNNTLVVHGLASAVSESELASHFSLFGDLIYCTLSDDLDTGYIKYYHREDAQHALVAMYGQTINGSRVKVAWGHGDIASPETWSLLMAPATSDFHPPQPLPENYGSFLVPLVYTSSMPEAIEESEPQTAIALNKQYLLQKEAYQRILKDALV